MTQTELARLAGVKLIEQLPIGYYLVRYGFRKKVGVVTFMTSVYLLKPTFTQITNNFLQYIHSIKDDEVQEELLCSFHVEDYAVVE